MNQITPIRALMPYKVSEYADKADTDVHRRVIFGLGLVAMLFIVFGGWAAKSSRARPVIAPGRVVVDSSIKKVQHPTGGIVKEIRVKNGDRVNGGDILVRLDDTQTRATLGIVESQLIELTARKARLAAERDSSEGIEFPAGFATASEESARVSAGERRLFAAKRKTAELKKAQLKE